MASSILRWSRSFVVPIGKAFGKAAARKTKNGSSEIFVGQNGGAMNL